MSEEPFKFHRFVKHHDCNYHCFTKPDEVTVAFYHDGGLAIIAECGYKTVAIDSSWIENDSDHDYMI